MGIRDKGAGGHTYSSATRPVVGGRGGETEGAALGAALHGLFFFIYRFIYI